MGEPSRLHRKGDDVGRPRPVQVGLVQRRDLAIVHQQDGEFAFRMP
jgi:hypothetical protein